MPKCQSKNTINNSQGNMTPSQPCYPTMVISEYFNTAEAQENDFGNNFMKMTDILKEKMGEGCFREIEEKPNINLEKLINPLNNANKAKEKQTQVKGTVQELK